MSNTYDIELKMNMAAYGGATRKEKLKEIEENRKIFLKWVKEQLKNFDYASTHLDEWVDAPNDMVSKDTNEVWSIDKGKWINLD
tara:strand:- start:90 stop:341 length:252 start_codon:yes stop_codon:yes gene_type:complete